MRNPKFWAIVPLTLLAIPLVVSCAKTVLELGVDGGPAGTGGQLGGGTSSASGGANGQPVLPPPTHVVSSSGNPSDCPPNPPTGAPPGAYYNNPNPDLGNSFCDVAEGEMCAYHYDQSYPTQADVPTFEECSCYEENSAIKRWACRTESVDDLCPPDLPAEGSDCFGYVTLSCPYPHFQRCTCQSSDRQWHCTDGSALPDSINHSPPPDTSTAAKKIVDLTDAEAHTWCAWYSAFAQGVGTPAARSSTVAPDGYLTTGLYVSWEFYDYACLAEPLGEDQCVQNLGLLHCEATLGELTDCILTSWSGVPQPHGCGRFFEAANCDGTIVRRAPLAFWSEGGFAGGLNPDHSINCGSLRVR
jgi:hypothetical protein